MFAISTIKRNISRHKKKSFLSILISCMIVLFLLLYISNIEKNQLQLIKLGKTIPITGSICNIDGSQDVGLQIDLEMLGKIRDTGLIKDEVTAMEIWAAMPNTYDESVLGCLFRFAGTDSFSIFSSFTPKDVSYIDGYDESFLKGSEPVCIVRDRFMEEENINLGDELEVEAYAQKYDKEGELIDDFEKIGLVKMKVIGSFKSKTHLRNEAPYIISPIGFVESIYEGTNVKSYASAARFTLKDSLKVNEFKSEMQKIGFSSTNIQAGFSRLGEALTLNDETFIMSATQLTKSLNMLKKLEPLIFIIVAAIGFISSYLLMQSRQNEFAIMRSLGTSKKKCFQIIFLESMILVFLGSIVGVCVSGFIVSVKFKIMASILAAFLIFYMLGTTVALLLLNRFSVMAILSKTD